MKRNHFQILICLLGFLLVSTSLFAQISPEQLNQGKELLQEKDIPEDEVRRKLEERGIDPDNIPTEMLPQMEGIMQEIIAEIEASRGSIQSGSSKSKVGFQETTVIRDTVKVDNIAVEDEGEVLKNIEKGASLEEAVSERISEELAGKQGGKAAVFGQHIFRNNSVSVFRTTESSFTPDNYVFGVGDEIAITIFGVSQADVSYEIEDDGFIRPSNLPKIYLKGLNYKQAKTLIRNRFRQAYSFNPDQINITLKTARTITVNIFGEVGNPGSYTISALNSSINALMAAGGVKNTGSVRHIQISSNGKTRKLDLYDFINNPGKKVNIDLQNNDVIFVPIIQKTAHISGGVKRAGTYEILDNENFIDLMKLANGFKPNADKTIVNAYYFDGNKRVHKDIDLTNILAGKENLNVNNQDRFYIRAYTRDAEDFVVINGPVEYPGKYALAYNMTVMDLIKKAEIQNFAREDMAYLIRINEDNSNSLIRIDLAKILKDAKSKDNIKLNPRDRLVLYSKSRFKDTYQVHINGAVRNPITTFWSENKSMTVMDLINLGGGLKTYAADFGYVTTPSLTNPKNRNYKMINIKEIVKNPSSNDNISIRPGARVYIFGNQTFSDDFNIVIKGAVRKETNVPYSSTLNLRDLITMAGGLRKEAASNKIDIYRLEIKNDVATRTIAQTIEIDADFNPLDPNTVLNLKPYDFVVVRYSPEFEPMKFVHLKGEVKYPGPYALLSDNETVADVIERAGGLTHEAYPKGAHLIRNSEISGYFILQLSRALKIKSSKANIVLKDGDVIKIPKTMDYVAIEITATNADQTYAEDILEEGLVHLSFRGSKSARWYINNFAGGYKKRAMKSSTQVLLANGQIKRTRKFLFFKIYPRVKKGSTVSVVMKPKKEKRERRREPITSEKIFQTITNTLALTTSAITTVVLANTLK